MSTLFICLSADGQEFRKDLSHPVHADNCVLDAATGKCEKEQPAYTWRDYRYGMWCGVHVTDNLVVPSCT